MQHRADDRVYRNVKLAAFKLHIAEDGLSVGIEPPGREHVFIFIYIQLDAGVNVERNYGCQRIRCSAEAFEHKSTSNEQHQHSGNGGKAAQRGSPFLFHVNYLSFLMVTRAEDIVQSVGGCVGNGGAELRFYAVIFHFGYPPSQS